MYSTHGYNVVSFIFDFSSISQSMWNISEYNCPLGTLQTGPDGANYSNQTFNEGMQEGGWGVELGIGMTSFHVTAFLQL